MPLHILVLIYGVNLMRPLTVNILNEHLESVSESVTAGVSFGIGERKICFVFMIRTLTWFSGVFFCIIFNRTIPLHWFPFQLKCVTCITLLQSIPLQDIMQLNKIKANG